MLTNKQTEALAPKIKVAQIILGALVIGATIPFILFLIMRPNPKFTQDFGMIPMIGVIFAIGGFSASFVMKMIQRKQSVTALAKEIPQKGESNDGLINKAFIQYQTTMVICGALIEGPTFLNILMYFLEGSVLNVGCVIVGLMLLASHFPFFNKVISSVEWLVDSAKDESKMGI